MLNLLRLPKVQHAFYHTIRIPRIFKPSRYPSNANYPRMIQMLWDALLMVALSLSQWEHEFSSRSRLPPRLSQVRKLLFHNKPTTIHVRHLMCNVDLPKFCNQSWLGYERRSIIWGLLWEKNGCFLFTKVIYKVLASGKRIRYRYRSYRYPLIQQRSRSGSMRIESAVPVRTSGVVDIYFLWIGGAVLWRVSKLGWHGPHCFGREWRPDPSHGPANSGRHHCQRPANCCLEVE